MSDSDDAPKIQIDSDWKAQAQAEKEKFAAQSKPPSSPAAASGPGGGEGMLDGKAGRASGDASAGDAVGASGGAAGDASGSVSGVGQMPPANFETLLSSFVTQALFAMGAIPDPQTGQPVMHLDLARHHIDMLSVLEEKTKNNLSEDETKMLAGTLYELRNRYVQVANAQRGG